MADLNDINKLVRKVVRELLAMPENSVRPANQNAPGGAKTEQFATVLIATVDDTGEDDHKFKDDAAPALTVTETAEGHRRMMASIQFFRGDAHTKASRLRTLLTMGAASDKLRAVGLGFIRASAVRNLSAVVDTYWEERGQIDLEFYLVAKETATVQTYGRFPITVSTESSTTSSEVIAP